MRLVSQYKLGGIAIIDDNRFVQLYLGYQPKTGFLQSQIKRLPMLYDEDYTKVDDQTVRSVATCCENINNASNNSLEELAMP